MKPKSLRTFGTRVKPYYAHEGYTGASRIISKISTAKNEISETVVVNDPTLHESNTISESVAVVIT